MKSNVLISRFVNILDNLDKRNETVPGLILSHAGFGKTSTIRMYAKYKDYNCVELIPSQYASDDIVGIQAMDMKKNELVRKAPSWYRGLVDLAKNGKRTLLFIDEITTCSPFIQGPLLDLIFSKSLGEYKLPENTFIIAAGNYASDLNGEFTMSNPLVNRFVLLNLNDEDFDIAEILNQSFKNVKTQEEIEKYLELNDDNKLCYDYDSFSKWIYESKDVDFSVHSPEEIDGVGLVGFTSVRSIDFSTRFAREFMQHYADDSWMRIVGDTLGTSAKREGKPLRNVIAMMRDKFSKTIQKVAISLGELLSQLSKAEALTAADLVNLKKSIIATPAHDITNHNLQTLINIVKSDKPGVKCEAMNECITLLTNKFNEV